ncbi:3215_t:CDS:1, partial [Cetraspora pellucida]
DIHENEVVSENVVPENITSKNVVPKKHDITKSHNQKVGLIVGDFVRASSFQRKNSQISVVIAFEGLDVFLENNALNELLQSNVLTKSDLNILEENYHKKIIKKFFSKNTFNNCTFNF